MKEVILFQSMFGKILCVFLVLCEYVNSAEYNHGDFLKNSPTDVQMKLNNFSKERLKTIRSIKQETMKTKNIRKRGIVMDDSDFDYPSEIYAYENNLDKRLTLEEKNEGSGVDEHDEELIKTTVDDTKPMSELHKITSNLTVLTQSTTAASKPTIEEKHILTSINTEGSGDDETLITEEYFYYTKEVTTKSTPTPEYDIQVKISDVCLNSTCNTNDLFIFTSDKRSNIPEGANFTLTCKNNNHSLDNMLYWYKSNGSEYFLQTLGTKSQLHLNIPNTKMIHSGTYVCVKQVSKHTCCIIKSYLVIYEVPLYKYHLMITGLIVFGGLLLCIFLSVGKSIALKKYNKEFTKKHGNMKNLL